MFKLGLTGSIGMGKSTTAKMFADLGCAVWDADAAVHRLYASGGDAALPISDAFPSAIRNGAVSREALRKIIASDDSALRKIEQIVHPLVAKDRVEFVKNATSDITVFDIPLLFETGGNTAMDAVVCVSIPPEVQESRVLGRGTMTPEAFGKIRTKQMPNDEKCARSDFVIITDTLEHAQAQVKHVVDTIRNRQSNA